MQQEMQEKSEALIPDRDETWEVRKNKTMGAEDVTRTLCQLGPPVEWAQGEGMLESKARGWTLCSMLLKMFTGSWGTRNVSRRFQV